MDVRISVIIPIYNAEAHLSACLDSVLAQLRPDMEVILVDDGSTDGSARICARCAAAHAQFRYLRRENAGPAAARNFGIRQARGEFLMFVDADDLLSPSLTEELLARMDDGTDIVCCSCTAFSDADGLEAPMHFFAEDFAAATPAEKEKLFLQLMDARFGQSAPPYYTAIGVPWGKLYRAELLRAHDLRFPPLRRMQDNIFNMYAFTFARRIVYLDAPLYRYRIDHVTSTAAQTDRICAMLEARERWFAEHGASATPAVVHGWYMERLRTLREGMRRCARAMPFRQARASIAALCAQPVYQRLLGEEPPAVSRKLQLILRLARLRMYGALAVCMRLLKYRAKS